MYIHMIRDHLQAVKLTIVKYSMYCVWEGGGGGIHPLLKRCLLRSTRSVYKYALVSSVTTGGEEGALSQTLSVQYRRIDCEQ